MFFDGSARSRGGGVSPRGFGFPSCYRPSASIGGPALIGNAPIHALLVGIVDGDDVSGPWRVSHRRRRLLGQLFLKASKGFTRSISPEDSGAGFDVHLDLGCVKAAWRKAQRPAAGILSRRCTSNPSVLTSSPSSTLVPIRACLMRPEKIAAPLPLVTNVNKLVKSGMHMHGAQARRGKRVATYPRWRGTFSHDGGLGQRRSRQCVGCCAGQVQGSFKGAGCWLAAVRVTLRRRWQQTAHGSGARGSR